MAENGHLQRQLEIAARELQLVKEQHSREVEQIRRDAAQKATMATSDQQKAATTVSVIDVCRRRQYAPLCWRCWMEDRKLFDEGGTGQYTISGGALDSTPSQVVASLVQWRIFIFLCHSVAMIDTTSGSHLGRLDGVQPDQPCILSPDTVCNLPNHAFRHPNDESCHRTEGGRPTGRSSRACCQQHDVAGRIAAA
jgi:hypothetical protein